MSSAASTHSELLERAEIRETDLGNTRRLARRHGANMRYVPQWGKWQVYDGRCWRDDTSNRAMSWAKDTVRGIYEEAAAEPDEDRRKALVRIASR
jgi:phage/plasmid-associated DNA primase